MYVYDFDQQSYSKKSYLDLFLENSYSPKKRGIYFGASQEADIIRYNDATTSEKEKNELFKKSVGPSFRKIIYGVLEMPNFRHLGKLNREELINETFFRLIEKIHRFTPGMVGKNGQPVKAYSYFSTIAKNYILEKKLRHEKILKNKADVETSIDLSVLSEDTLEKMSNYDKQDVELDDYVTNFKNTKEIILSSINEILFEEQKLSKPDADFIKLGYCLKYLIEKWDKVQFEKKNEFMRILTLYTGLPQQKVSFLFKKFKVGSLKKIKPVGNEIEKIEKVELIEIEEKFNENDYIDNDEDSEIPASYSISTMEEFEQQLYRHENKINKKQIKWTIVKKPPLLP